MIRAFLQKLINAAFRKLRLKYPVGYWVAAAEGLRGHVVEIIPDSGPLAAGSTSLRLPVDENIFPFVMARNSWQKNDVAMLVSRLTSGQTYTLVDVGANIGLFSRQLFATTSAVQRAWCFEPAPTNYDCLTHNLRHLKDRVRTFNVAIDDRTGIQTFYTDADNIGNYSLNSDAMEGRKFETITVRSMAANEICDLMNPNIDGRLIWKSDTQGYDEKIMTLFPQEFWRGVDVALLEIWQIRKPDLDWDRFSAILDDFPFKTFSSNPDRALTSSQIVEFARRRSGQAEDLILARR